MNVHHTVIAAILAELGFDSFEGESNELFQDFIPLWGRIPLERNNRYLLGVAGIQGTLYQISVQGIDVRLPN